MISGCVSGLGQQDAYNVLVMTQTSSSRPAEACIHEGTCLLLVCLCFYVVSAVLLLNSLLVLQTVHASAMLWGPALLYTIQCSCKSIGFHDTECAVLPQPLTPDISDTLLTAILYMPDIFICVVGTGHGESVS